MGTDATTANGHPAATLGPSQEGTLITTLLRRGPQDIIITAAAGVLAAATAATAAVAPRVSIGIVTIVVLLLLPFEALLAAFVATAIYSLGHGFELGPFSVLPGQIVLVVLTVRCVFERRAIPGPTWGWPGWLLGAWLGLEFLSSIVNAPEPWVSLVAAVRLTIAVTAYLVVVRAVDRERRLLLVARVALGTIAVVAAIGIVAVVVHLLGSSLLNGFLAGRPGTPKGVTPLPKAFMVENNIYGSFAAAGAMGFFVLMREQHAVMTWRAAAVGFAVCTVGTILSATRAAWIAVVVGLVVYLLARRPHARRPGLGAGPVIVPLIFGVLALAGIWLTVAPAPVPEPLSTLASPIAESAGTVLDFGGGTGAARVNRWDQAIGDLRSSPIIGLGTDSFGQRHLIESTKATEPAHLGSLFVRVLYDTGIVGLALFLGFLLAAAWPRRAIRHAVGDAPSIARAFISTCVVFAVAFIATDASFQPWPWVVLAIGHSAMVLVERGSTVAGPALAPAPSAAP